MKVDLVFGDELKKFIKQVVIEVLRESEKVSLSTQWTFSDFLEYSPFKSKTVARDFLNHPPYKEFFEEHGIVKYPSANRDPYLIDAKKMTKWWDENKTLVLSEKKLWRTS